MYIEDSDLFLRQCCENNIYLCSNLFLNFRIDVLLNSLHYSDASICLFFSELDTFQNVSCVKEEYRLFFTKYPS